MKKTIHLINLFCILFNISFAQVDIFIPNYTVKANYKSGNNEVITVGLDSFSSKLIKFSSNNIVLLANRIPSVEIFHDVISTNSSIYITGATGAKHQVIKLDQSGNLIWAKETQNSFLFSQSTIKIQNDSLLIGFITDTSANIICLDTNGNSVWSKSIPYSSNVYLLTCDIWKKGNAIYLTYSGLLNLNFIKLRENGNLIWHKKYDFSSSFNPSFINNTIVHSENEFIINGSLQTNPFVVQMDSSGSILNAKEYNHDNGNANFSSEFVFINDKYYFMGYHDDPLLLYPIHRYYFAELDSMFNLIKQFEIGKWSETLRLNSSFTHSGNQFEFARSYGNNDDSTEVLRFTNPTQIVCDTSSSNSTVIDHTNFTVTNYSSINSGPSYISFNPTVAPVSFSYSFQCPLMAVSSIENENNLTVFPNPNNGQFTINLPKINEISQLKIYTTLGQYIYLENISPTENYKNVNLNLESGIYFVLIESENEIISRSKMIVE